MPCACTRAPAHARFKKVDRFCDYNTCLKSKLCTFTHILLSKSSLHEETVLQKKNKGDINFKKRPFLDTCELRNPGGKKYKWWWWLRDDRMMKIITLNSSLTRLHNEVRWSHRLTWTRTKTPPFWLALVLKKALKCILVFKCLNELVPPYLSDYSIRNRTINTYNEDEGTTFICRTLS